MARIKEYLWFFIQWGVVVAVLSGVMGCDEIDSTCRSIKISNVRPEIITDSNGKLVGIQIYVMVKGNTSNASATKVTVEVYQMLKWESTSTSFSGLSCDAEKEFRIFIPYGDLKYANGSIINDPTFFNGNSANVTIYCTKNSADQVATSDWSFGPKSGYFPSTCATSKPSQRPILKVGDFDKTTNSSNLTITYSTDYTGYRSAVYLVAGTPLLGYTQSGEKEVNATPDDITLKLIPVIGTTNQYTYTWLSTISESSCYLQIGLSQKAGNCGESIIVYSTSQPLNGITGKAAVVKINSITAAQKDLTSASVTYAPKEYGAADIIVLAPDPNSTSAPTDITVSVSLPSLLSRSADQIAFYTNADFPNGLLKTISLTPTTKSNNDLYTVSWDGRDGSPSKRILLAGSYVITAIVTYPAGQVVICDSKVITVAAPNFVNLGVDYPGSYPTMIAGAISNYSNGAYDFGKVTYLNQSQHSNFEWLRKFSILSNTSTCNNYAKINFSEESVDGKITDAIIEKLAKKSAVLTYEGHSGVPVTSDARGFLIFNGNKLWGECTADGYTDACDTKHDVCFDYDCDGNSRANYYNDVLLAVLLGCRTGVGTPSVASSLLSYGVDCVISMKIRIWPVFANFWYQNFRNELYKNYPETNKVNTIEQAANAAYNDAVKDIAAFYVNIADDATFTQVQNHLGKYTDPDDPTQEYYYLESYGNTFKRENNVKNPSNEDVLNSCILPARYGAFQ